MPFKNKEDYNEYKRWYWQLQKDLELVKEQLTKDVIDVMRQGISFLVEELFTRIKKEQPNMTDKQIGDIIVKATKIAMEERSTTQTQGVAESAITKTDPTTTARVISTLLDPLRDPVAEAKVRETNFLEEAAREYKYTPRPKMKRKKIREEIDKVFEEYGFA